MKNWNGKEIPCARSRGGVIAATHPYHNLISTDCTPWPPPEITQKLYKSRHAGAFGDEDAKIASSGLGYYCDLQSLHSEDAITWSVFGTAARADTRIKEAWLSELFDLLNLPDIQTQKAEIYLWRRIPHPDTLVSGGPEIDMGILTANALFLGEAKWLSDVGGSQGKLKNKNQIQLRGEFLLKYGKTLFRDRPYLVVFGISLSQGSIKDATPDGIIFQSTIWEKVCALKSHPLYDEVNRYYEWKKANTQIR